MSTVRQTNGQLEPLDNWDRTLCHHLSRVSIDTAERRGRRRSAMKGRERAVVNQTNIGTLSEAALGKLLRDAMERIKLYGLFRAHTYHLELH